MGICGSATKNGTDSSVDIKDPTKLKSNGTDSATNPQTLADPKGKKDGPSTGVVTLQREIDDQSKSQAGNKPNSVHREGGEKPTLDNRDMKPRGDPAEGEVFVKPSKDKKPQDKPTGKKSQMQSHEASRDGPGDGGHGGRADKRKAKVIDVVDEKESGYFETFEKIEKKKTADDTANILNALMGHFFFSNLSQEEL